MKNQRLILLIGLFISSTSTFAQTTDQLFIANADTDELNVPNFDDHTLLTETTENSKKKSNAFFIQAGVSQYNFYDSGLYGEQVTYQSNGIYSGTLSGFRDLAGLYVKGGYMFNENFGLSADLAFHYGSNGSFIQNESSATTYETSADLNFQRIGIVGRFVGQEYPIKLSINSGIGLGQLDAYYLIQTYTHRVDYEGEVTFPMVFVQTELAIPIYKGLFLFTEYEYTVGWTEEFSLVHNNGSEYNEIVYRHPGLGGNNFRVGLGYEFGLQ
jgi:hypothetical protein